MVQLYNFATYIHIKFFHLQTLMSLWIMSIKT